MVPDDEGTWLPRNEVVRGRHNGVFCNCRISKGRSGAGLVTCSDGTGARFLSWTTSSPLLSYNVFPHPFRHMEPDPRKPFSGSSSLRSSLSTLPRCLFSLTRPSKTLRSSFHCLNKKCLDKSTLTRRIGSSSSPSGKTRRRSRRFPSRVRRLLRHRRAGIDINPGHSHPQLLRLCHQEGGSHHWQPRL